MSSFENVRTVEINDYVCNLDLSSGRHVEGVQVRKTNDNGSIRFNLNLNHNNLFFSIDVNQSDLPDITEILNYLKDNLNTLY